MRSEGTNDVRARAKVEGVTFSDSVDAKVERDSDAVEGVTVVPVITVGANVELTRLSVAGVIVSFRDGANRVAVNATVPGVTEVGTDAVAPMISINPTRVGLAVDNVNEAEAVDPVASND